MCLFWVVSISVSAQIHVSEKATLNITEDAYIYKEKEVVGNHNAMALHKDKGILLVAKSEFTTKEKPTNQKPKQNVLKNTYNHLAKTEKAKTKTVYRITSQPSSSKFSSSGADSNLAVVTQHFRELGITDHVFIIEKHIYNTENLVFGRNIHSERNRYFTLHKTRPPPLSC